MSCPCSDCLNGRLPRNIIEPSFSDTYVMNVHEVYASCCVLAASGTTLNLNDAENLGDLAVEYNDWTVKYCEVCELVLNSPAQYKEHLRGHMHKKQLETLNHQSLPAKSDGKSNSSRRSGSQSMMAQCSTSLVPCHLNTDVVINKTDVVN